MTLADSIFLARIGHRGHVSAATHSLEAGNSFPAYKIARKDRPHYINDFFIAPLQKSCYD
ncbi:MAG: hypothetical protein FWF77_07710 [Defluviitaleaceae bacterium]|nr:hypothetical protein [Defluviitaleaceae bacterium]